ncbi:uncharacterized protein LOC121400672 [Xenopus laevis]|uniref:Uncharacterized protein LOC121393841 n=1 Tax=Xenopus laevis TaxID=8355 RepID=A0A8J1MFI0_XENLA|nr:uncharacterized protein LOC121393841 [Xenopus laevis]XP_041419491.1 uncharacterized protein LOC121393841 [Xenopus laevis]XP_041440287.1 uncharacterized protein LOC121400671 [Xenopus laevis]XP_041440288.1 uncharacterized protein LOC121400671 [Xenopus laevis]XP_041440289.1 uncharacterized protein LOC121400672 [Xenopus laevis]XP_041440290.1 uncharacterized protein LOC121400672 [Xenopus laevis]
MSFADIAATTDRRADTFCFSEAERKKILNATQSLPTSTTLSGTEVLRKLENLKRREISWALHMSSLAEYAKAQRIPRGLRVMLQPALFKDNQEFLQKWQGILNRCSLDLITLTIQQLQTGTKELKQQLHTMEEEYRNSAESNAMMLRELEVKMERLQRDILEVKLRKFRRDTIDYSKGEVYSWKDYRRTTRRYRTSSAISTDRASEQSLELSQSSPAGSQHSAVSFLGGGRRTQNAKPGGEERHETASQQTTRKKTNRR